MIHILEEHFHDKAKAQVLRCLVLLADVVVVDYWCYSSHWFRSCVTGTTSTVFSSGRTINPETTTLELIQVQKILYRYPHDRGGYVYPCSTFYQRMIKIQVNLTAAKQEKRAFLRGKSTDRGSVVLFPAPQTASYSGDTAKRWQAGTGKIYFWSRFWTIHQLLTCSLI